MIYLPRVSKSRPRVSSLCFKKFTGKNSPQIRLRTSFFFFFFFFSSIFCNNVKWIWLQHKIWIFVTFFWKYREIQKPISLLIWYYSKIPFYTWMKICDHVIFFWLLVFCSFLFQPFSTKIFNHLCTLHRGITLSLWWEHLFYLNNFSSRFHISFNISPPLRGIRILKKREYF